MKKLLCFLLTIISSFSICITSSARATVKKVGVEIKYDQVSNQQQLCAKNYLEYDYGMEFKTQELGYGFSFSINDLASITKLEGNAIGIRIKNNSKIVCKAKFGMGIADNTEGENLISYMTNTSNGSNQNLTVDDSCNRSFVESRNSITAIPGYFDGIIYMPLSRFGTLGEVTRDKYMVYFRFGGALCDFVESDLIVYEIFDCNVTEQINQFGKIDYDLYEAETIKSLGTADTFVREADVFWGGYSYELGTPEKRQFDKSITQIGLKSKSEINYITYQETWIGDVKILESFAQCSENLTDQELRGIYSVTGAKATLSSAKIGLTNALNVLVGDWESDYVNATFASVNISSIDNNMADWSDALGVTLMIKNNEDKFINLNVEFLGTESDGAQFRWSVNFPGARIYAYDINTGEQWCFITNTRIFLPPNFEGWIRIPFSQYDPNTGVAAFSWELDLNKYLVSGVIIGCSMKTNPNCSFSIANFGLYYHNFKQASFFETGLTTIKDCLEIQNYKEKYLNEK